MKIPVKFRPLLSNLAAFALGAGLAAAWHLNRKEADPPQANTPTGEDARRTTALPAGRGFDLPSAFDSTVRRVPPTTRRDTKHGSASLGEALSGWIFLRPDGRGRPSYDRASSRSGVRSAIGF